MLTTAERKRKDRDNVSNEPSLDGQDRALHVEAQIDKDKNECRPLDMRYDKTIGRAIRQPGRHERGLL